LPHLPALCRRLACNVGARVIPRAENNVFRRFSAYQIDGIELRKLGA